ncbi:amidohydrolase [Bradyrhizobium sp. U87765 SZCCT0131]|uniref:amidohydrolase n=1 Tax=unclassified Bradyrhizobium TaxID=2631580 RepID=UPI001BAE413B|nr:MULTISPECIES: amidohydrolase [unclassified Bradyrhizobium]MBR1221689.1 amidohydrolase [Bradyrhizobium sp. U87765 SZCCT0131]MBR1264388.1 amidohydrolase [Bradyrhizobium sp. U87765 SZCCT0134]MBR1304705.1 amidohydrolase [Bradyrhizobium sp. U87765 SZCCT0110]MBR1322438.1 amidohydrolase [Bradyrhizobium sp. U87765 SZCCT0109]MBR1346634.1 amidohydrolase [Bradyrhizobium sp. U87765 SZCCT0048]
MVSAVSPADLVLTNGRIYTMDRARNWASAVAIRGGRIVAVGGDAEIKPLIGPRTEVRDLAGRMVMPGIVDVHNHIISGGRADLYETRLPPGIGVAEIAGRVAASARNAPPRGWIVGGRWETGQLGLLNTAEALAALDAASGDHPVLLRDDSGHNRWLNSAGLRLAGITAETVPPDNGEIGRDAMTGALTGVLIETASALGEAALVEAGHYTAQMDRDAVRRAVAILNGFGVTSFLDAATMQPTLAALKGLDDRGELSAWAVASLPVSYPAAMIGPVGDALFAMREDYRSTHVRPDCAKIFLDGVPGAKTAAFHEAYVTDALHGCCFRGMTMFTVPDLVRWIGKCEKQNIAVKIHCAGDAAVTQALDAIEVVRSFNGPTSLMHHVAHASYILPADIPRFAALGVAADLSPIIWYPTLFLEGHKAAMGEERATRFWPNRSLHETGALMAGGSDWPVVSNPDPWTGIEGMVTRRNPSGAFPGVALWPEQALDLATVLEIYTINGARVLGLEQVTGSIEIGKSADMIILDRNVFEMPADEIADVKVLATLFEGRAVHTHAGA